jgi:hypothetical protein
MLTSKRAITKVLELTKSILRRMLLLSGLLLFSCSMHDEANRIAENFCHCKDSIFKGNDDLTSKKIKLEDCFYRLSKEIDHVAKDSASKDTLTARIMKLITRSCPDSFDKEKMFQVKRSINENLKIDSKKCKDYFTDGDYVPAGIQEPIVITRKGNLNIVKRTEFGCESEYEVKWIEDCAYYLILKKTSCKDENRMVGDSLLVRVIDIKNDTIHYEIDIKSRTFPQMMRKL